MRKLKYESLSSFGTISKYTINGFKNTSIFREYKNNHIEGSYRLSIDGKETPILEEEYLVIRIPNNKENTDKLDKIFEKPFSPDRMFFVCKKSDDYIELSYYLYMAFTGPFISRLEELNIIKSFTWIEIPKNKLEGIYYINAKWYQLPFNIISAIYEGIMYVGKKLYLKLFNKNKEERVNANE